MATDRRVHFRTARDFRAIKSVIQRSAIGLKGPDVLLFEVLPESNDDECSCHWQDDDWEWHQCDRDADLRLVRQRRAADEDFGIPASRYSEPYCLECIEREAQRWLDERLDELHAGVEEVLVNAE